MSALRICGRRISRPHLSVRYQLLRRAESTAPRPAPAGESSPPPSFLKRHRSRIIWAALGLTLGVVAGNFVVHTIAPPKLPEAGSREDGILMADLNRRIDEEFKVKVLRGKCLGVAKQLKGEDGGWVEVVGMPSITEGGEKAEKKGLIEHMQGAKGLGVERLFWERGEKKLVAVVWFGGSLSGWPGVTHGGMLATALVEKLSLAASLADGNNADILAAATPQRLPGTGSHSKMLQPVVAPDQPVHLDLTYAKPTYANNFYVIRVSPTIASDQSSEHVDASSSKKKLEYEATLETLDAKICVKATARFEPGTIAQKAETAVREGSRRSYEEFKQWLWPSRQKMSQIN